VLTAKYLQYKFAFKMYKISKVYKFKKKNYYYILNYCICNINKL